MVTHLPLQPLTYSYIETENLKSQTDFPRPASKFQLLLKRIFDFSTAFIGLIILSPILFLLAILIYLTSPGPIFYKSLRIGKNRQQFYMYKFRTMVNDAEKLRDTLYEQAGLQGQLFKIKNDPRLTCIGGFLRKYSLDELPQLLNVIRNEMSLVGPRPLIPEESRMFKPPYTNRFNVMPGMTGAWQINGRSNISFEQLCKLELSYVQGWNFWMDINILLQTIPSVLMKKGAY